MEATPWDLARLGETEALKRHVQGAAESFDWDAVDDSACTALVWAAKSGQLETVRYLVALGADINAPGFGGLTPLHHAASISNETVVAALLENGAADVNRGDDAGSSSLHIAAARGSLNILTRLIDAKGDVNKTNTKGVAPLHFACLNDQYALIRKLVEAGANPNQQDGQGNTPLHVAARLGFTNCASMLAKADKTVINASGETPVDVSFDAAMSDLLKKEPKKN